jgi:hypothetical protein
MAGRVCKNFVTAFLAASGELAVVTSHGDIVAANDAWRQYCERRGAGPRGTTGANYWHLTTSAAVRGDDIAATASDALEAVFGGYADRASLKYQQEPGAGGQRFHLRVEQLTGSGHFLVSHEAIIVPGQRADRTEPQRWTAQLVRSNAHLDPASGTTRALQGNSFHRRHPVTLLARC